MEDVVQVMGVSPYTDFLLRAGMREAEERAKAESSLGRPGDGAAVASRDAPMG
jgi:hypothetical protein